MHIDEITNPADINIKKSVLKKRKIDLMKKTPASQKRAWRITKSIAGDIFKYTLQKERVSKPYILDIYIKSIKVGIEIDGSVHKEASGYDNRRDDYLYKFNKIKIYRFTNDEVQSEYFRMAIWGICLDGLKRRIKKIKENAVIDGVERQFNDALKFDVLA